MLNERRTLTVTVDEKNQEVALRWDSEFQVGPNAGKVTISGPNYDGLGIRLPESFNHVAKFQNSADQPYTAKDTHDVTTAKWTSVSGQMDGREVMLVMFGCPDNARGDTAFYTMLDPFAYLSATQALDKKPLEYAAGDKFSLSYLLTVYSANKTRGVHSGAAANAGRKSESDFAQPSVTTLQHSNTPAPQSITPSPSYEQNPHWH